MMEHQIIPIINFFNNTRPLIDRFEEKIEFSIRKFVKKEDMQMRICSSFRSITAKICQNLNRSFKKRLILCSRETFNYFDI